MRHDDVLVVKLGGGEGLDLAASCADLAVIARERPLLVFHGVSAMMNQLCQERGFEVRTLTSPGGHTSRYTDPQTRDLFVEAAEAVNSMVVAELRSHDIAAVGLVAEQVVVHGQRKDSIRAMVNGRRVIVRDDYSGSITAVDADHLRAVLDAGQVPVLPPMAASADGLLNIDGDRGGAAVAAALQAAEYVILSNVRGLYSNFPEESSFVAHVAGIQIESALDWAQGRMKRKVLGAQEALRGGVGRVVIGDGRVAHPVREALAGSGTVFTA